MKNHYKKIFLIVIVTLFFLQLLLSSKECIALASNGLMIWYTKMIPSLFPFMVLSGFLVKSKLSDSVSKLFKPVLGIFFPYSPAFHYTIFMGFLCGFPMGAKTVADFIQEKKLTQQEGQYLLSFCNNIGPLYLLGFVSPLFPGISVGKLLFIMYMIPLLYGFFLQFFLFSQNKKREMVSNTRNISPLKSKSSFSPITCFQDSMHNAIEQITMLGGCMIFFNCLQIFPKQLYICLSKYLKICFPNQLPGPLYAFVEIGGGIQFISENQSKYGNTGLLLSILLFFLTFGGISCMVQTSFIIKNTNLSLFQYINHKLIQSILVFVVAYLI